MNRFVISTLNGLVVLALFAVPLAIGQEQTQSKAGAKHSQPQSETHGRRISDRDLAQWAILDNRLEVELSQWAEQKAEAQSVKQFAEKMVKDHSAYLENLEKCVGKSYTSTTKTQQTQVKSGQPSKSADTSRKEGQSEFLQIQQAICQKMLATCKDMLGDKEGAKFDRAFIETQIMLHHKMLTSLNVFHEYAESQEVQQLLQDGIKVTKEHLKLAETIMHQLDQPQKTAS